MGLLKLVAVGLVAATVVAHEGNNDDTHADDDVHLDPNSGTPTSWPTRTNSLIPFPVTLSPSGSPLASRSAVPSACSWHCTAEDAEQGACMPCQRGQWTAEAKVNKKLRKWLARQDYFEEAGLDRGYLYNKLPKHIPRHRHGHNDDDGHGAHHDFSHLGGGGSWWGHRVLEAIPGGRRLSAWLAGEEAPAAAVPEVQEAAAQ